MEYVRLGRSSLRVSRIGFGAMGVGDKRWRSWVLTEDEARLYRSPITAEGNPLSRNGSGKLSLAVGVTGAVFSAVAPGTVEVTATRPTCASASNAPTCDSVALFRVTVSVHS